MYSFRSRATLLFGSISIVLTLALSLSIGALASHRMIHDQGEALHVMARGVGDSLAEGVEERLRDIELMAASPEATQLLTDAEPLGAAIDRLQNARPSFAWIGAVDAAGIVRASAGGLLIGQDMSQRPWFRAGRAGPHVGDVHLAKLLAKLLPAAMDGGPPRFVDFAVPVRAPDGRMVGMIGAHGHWDWAGQLVTRLSTGSDNDRAVQVFIVSRNGEVLHRPPGSAAAAALPPLPAQPGIVDWPNDLRYLTAVVKMPARSAESDLGWTIVARQPESIALAAANGARSTVLALGLLAALIAMAASWVIATRMGRPLRSMSAAVQRIEAGDFSAGIPDVGGSSEMQQLNGALQSMTRTLTSNQQALRAANESLELRVRERTVALEAANDELLRLASRDALTGLFNRRSVDLRLADEMSRHRRNGLPLSVLLIDIDHFKRVNDNFGHIAGDAALRHVALALSAHGRSTDFVARFGGEEFIVLLPETGLTQARQVADKLRLAVSAAPAPSVGVLTVSVGVAEMAPLPYQQGTMPASELLRRADSALYAAKDAGRDGVRAYDDAPAEALRAHAA